MLKSLFIHLLRGGITMRNRKETVDQTDPTQDEIENLVISQRKRKSGRVCRLCGKDPYPNYFYCPACHHRVSHSGHSDEHKDFVEGGTV